MLNSTPTTENNQIPVIETLKPALMVDDNASTVSRNSATTNTTSTTANSPSNTQSKTVTTLKIAAIDNGLAFPFKHPDEWRACMAIYFSLS